MKTIKFQGKECNVGYSMMAACLYERTTGINPLSDDERNQSLENLLTMAYCQLVTTDRETDYPDLDDVMMQLTAEEMTDLLQAAAEERAAYYLPLAGDKKKDKKEEEADSKNS